MTVNQTVPASQFSAVPHRKTDPKFLYSALTPTKTGNSVSMTYQLPLNANLTFTCTPVTPFFQVMSIGRSIEIYKEKGHPKDVLNRFGTDKYSATHAVAHTRMATETAVTTEQSHPFSTELDLYLVHNTPLSNHNCLRSQLKRQGSHFQTDNDSEVAAGYLTWGLHR